MPRAERVRKGGRDEGEKVGGIFNQIMLGPRASGEDPRGLRHVLFSTPQTIGSAFESRVSAVLCRHRPH